MLPPDPELVSVVIPTRNRRDQLQKAIQSVQDQTWPNVEIIVVDDGSSDGTGSCLHGRQAADARIHVIRNEVSKGGGKARNQGIERARGPYIAFLDDDDLWSDKRKLELQLAMLKANERASAVSCGFTVLREQQASLNRRNIRVTPPRDEQQLLRSNHLGGASMCVTTKEVLEKVGGFDPSLASGQDWDLWLKLNQAGDVLVCDEPLVTYSSYPGARITTNGNAVYKGRRRIFFRYRSRMSQETRAHSLGELIFCRRVMLGPNLRVRTRGFVQAWKLVRGTQRIRYVYRCLKLFVPWHLFKY